MLTETGKTPLKIFIFGHIVKYWWHLNTSESHILQAVMKTNTVFAENNIKCWNSGVTKILNWIGTDCISEENCVDISQDHVNQTKTTLSRFRFSTHCLPIETMRHLIPRNLRFCPFCCTLLGEEQHFLMSCKNPNISLPEKILSVN